MKLPHGLYDIKIYYLELLRSKWLRNIAVNTGDKTERIVRFEFGKVVVNITGPGGKGLYSNVKAYEAGTSEEVRSINSSQVFLKLPLGNYDILVYSMDFKQEQWFRDILVTDGVTMEKTVQFPMHQDTKINRSEERNINTEALQMTGLGAQERNIITDKLQMTGLNAQERNIITDKSQMTGLNAQERTIYTDILQMTGLNAQERAIHTETLQMTGIENE